MGQQRVPILKEEPDVIEQKEKIFNYVNQSHISKKNLSKLKVFASAFNAKIPEFASIAFEVARVKPYKKRRLKVLPKERRDLLQQLEETGLIFAHHY